ncbi:DUF317 domain-containing protein [Streptacidiphilus fuscans]|uniref:DUF317 domain-containing protein n=1 Tax=Streptacidiphilus fuscans TaxID=2789292 RepID=A0A931BCQ4_9ACTN|nr:DUF317 domain-containing protein [Streptacidiphilus fuscans]MBF9071798.1 DUF317 domain-containing protein [Streptacidiphilus fuscans]
MTVTPANTPPAEPPEHGRRYLVAPRYLAGHGDQPEQALAPLLEAGWTPVSDIALDGLTLLSPDLNTLMRYRPEDRIFPAWTVYDFAPTRAGGPVWTATFTWDTPTEILTGFTTALARPQDTPEPPSEDPFAAFGEAGWTLHRGLLGTLYTDYRFLADAHRRHRVDEEREMAHLDETWLVTAPGAHGSWFATATRATPVRLLSALAAATLDPRPALRTSLTGVAHQAQITALPHTRVPPKPPASNVRGHGAARRTGRR